MTDNILKIQNTTNEPFFIINRTGDNNIIIECQNEQAKAFILGHLSTIKPEFYHAK